MDLSAHYLGLDLRNPVVASASPRASSVDGVRQLARGGVAAVVLPSMFEEELHREAAQNAALLLAGTLIGGGSYVSGIGQTTLARVGGSDSAVTVLAHSWAWTGLVFVIALCGVALSWSRGEQAVRTWLLAVLAARGEGVIPYVLAVVRRGDGVGCIERVSRR